MSARHDLRCDTSSQLGKFAGSRSLFAEISLERKRVKESEGKANARRVRGDFRRGKRTLDSREENEVSRRGTTVEIYRSSRRRRPSDGNARGHRNSGGILPLRWTLSASRETRLEDDIASLFTIARGYPRARRTRADILARVIDDSRGGGTMTSREKGRVMIQANDFAGGKEEVFFFPSRRIIPAQ